jgi:hypothetical protein
MFRQDDISQFFFGNSGPFKRQNEQRTQYFKDYEKSNSLFQSLNDAKLMQKLTSYTEVFKNRTAVDLLNWR